MKRILRSWRTLASFAMAVAFFAAGWTAKATATGFLQDGPGWLGVSTECRLLYVDGFDTAYRLGAIDVSMKYLDRLSAALLKKQITKEAMHEITAKEQEPSSEDIWTNKMSWTGWTATKETNSQIKEGMDRFYANSANQAICWREAFLIVSHSIAGQTFSERDMSAIRRASVKSGCE